MSDIAFSEQLANFMYFVRNTFFLLPDAILNLIYLAFGFVCLFFIFGFIQRRGG